MVSRYHNPPLLYIFISISNSFCYYEQLASNYALVPSRKTALCICKGKSSYEEALAKTCKHAMSCTGTHLQNNDDDFILYLSVIPYSYESDQLRNFLLRLRS
jgi:hypothetical protein